MKSRTIGKLCSALILCVLLSLLLQQHYVSGHHMTRQEFLEKEAADYDKQIAKPSPYAVHLVASLIFCGALFGAYELIAFGISKVAVKADAYSQE
jgi:hypothetical protein